MHVGKECVPYSLGACEDAAKARGKEIGGKGYEFASSSHSTKGCYGYRDGAYFDHVYYGTGGTLTEMKRELKSPKFRPLGHDCNSAGNPFILLKCYISGRV